MHIVPKKKQYGSMKILVIPNVLNILSSIEAYHPVFYLDFYWFFPLVLKRGNRIRTYDLQSRLVCRKR